MQCVSVCCNIFDNFEPNFTIIGYLTIVAYKYRVGLVEVGNQLEGYCHHSRRRFDINNAPAHHVRKTVAMLNREITELIGPDQGRIYVGAGEGTCLQIHLLPLPLQIQKLADRSDVIFEVPKCSKMQILTSLRELRSLTQTP